jgi:hypothetical protein
MLSPAFAMLFLRSLILAQGKSFWLPEEPGSGELDEPIESTPLTGEQRLLLLDTWRPSGLPAGDFAALIGGISKHTLYAWRHKFESEGPAGLEDRPRGGSKGSRLPEVTKRAILMLKQDNPEWGCERISPDYSPQRPRRSRRINLQTRK